MSIRPAVREDLPRMLEIYTPYVENTTYSFEYDPPALAEFTRRFEIITQQFPWLVWEEQGTVLGYAYGSAPFQRAAYGWCAEATVYLCPEAHRKGIGSRLYAVLEEILRLQGYRKLYALVTSENHGSLAFHKAVGYAFLADFHNCGEKFGRLCSVSWLEKDLNRPEDTPGRPVSFLEIRPKTKHLF